MNATANGMKKLLACLTLCALLLSLGTVFASAEDLPDGSFDWTPGAFVNGGEEDFRELGEIPIQWKPDFTDRVDITDGDVNDWYGVSIADGCRVVTQKHMVSWFNEGSGMPTDWKMTVMFVADEDNLYVAFEVVDADFTYGTNPESYDGDAIQLALDFGCKLGEAVEVYPDQFSNPKNVLYSFSCVSDGQPLAVVRQETDHDGVMEYAVGAARKTDYGWSAELALPWKTLYEDYLWKAWDSEPRVWVGAQENIPLKLGMSIYYINRSDADTITWAAGAVAKNMNDNGHPCLSWTVYDNAAFLTLDASHAIELNCDGIIGVIEDYPMTEIMTTDAPDFPVEPPVSYETVAPTYTGDELDELQAILEKYGCTSVLGMGSLALLTALAAAAYVARKRP